MSSKGWLIASGAFVAGIAATVMVSEESAPVVKTKIVRANPVVKYYPRDRSVMPDSCKKVVEAAYVFDDAAEQFYLKTGEASDLLSKIRNSIGESPAVIDKLVKQYDALEVKTFTDPTEASGSSAARQMSDAIITIQTWQPRCDADIKKNTH